MSLNRYLKSHTLQFHSVYQSDTAFLIIRGKDKIIPYVCGIKSKEKPTFYGIHVPNVGGLQNHKVTARTYIQFAYEMGRDDSASEFLYKRLDFLYRHRIGLSFTLYQQHSTIFTSINRRSLFYSVIQKTKMPTSIGMSGSKSE